MRTGTPSATALFVARARARHQTDEPRIFSDPLAHRILGESEFDTTQFDGDLDDEFVSSRRMFIAARSRFADDAIAAATAHGTDQVVILGAGLDTTAYRHAHDGVRFFEVDHPDTQRWKRRRLSEALIETPTALSFVAADLEKSNLAAELAEAGFDRTRAAVFIALGVIAYLHRPAVEATLRYIAEHPDCEVVFDYFYPVTTRADHRTDKQIHARANRVAAAGEPWLTFYTASKIRSLLLSFGYRHIDDHAANHLLATYGSTSTTYPTSSEPHLIYARAT